MLERGELAIQLDTPQDPPHPVPRRRWKFSQLLQQNMSVQFEPAGGVSRLDAASGLDNLPPLRRTTFWGISGCRTT